MTASKKDLHNSEYTRIALLEQSIEHINESLIKLDRNLEFKFSLIEKRFDSIEKEMKSGFSECRQLSWGHFRWLMGTVIICILVPIAKGFMA
jgi:hypothetical protein